MSFSNSERGDLEPPVLSPAGEYLPVTKEASQSSKVKIHRVDMPDIDNLEHAKQNEAQSNECEAANSKKDRKKSSQVHNARLKAEEYQFQLMPYHIVKKPHGQKLYKCDICNGEYRYAFSLKRHYLRSHINYKYLCDADISNCNITVSSYNKSILLDKKFDSSVSDSKSSSSNDGSKSKRFIGLYRCHLCSKLFNEKNDLKNHMINHPASSTHKQFFCTHCDMAFTHNQNLVRHLSTHSTTKNYRCKYCAKCFPSISNQRRHERTHEGLKPYQCNYCFIFFNQSGDLKKHIQRHHPEYYHPCLLCPKLFSSLALLRTHMSTIHISSVETGSLKLNKKKVFRGTVSSISDNSAETTTDQVESLRLGDSFSDLKYACTICRKRFATYVNMCRHRRLAHQTFASKKKQYKNSAIQSAFYGNESYNFPAELSEADFYITLAQRISDNLLNYVDGKTYQLSNNESIQESNKAGKYTSKYFENKENTISWSSYNFPPDFNVYDNQNNDVATDLSMKSKHSNIQEPFAFTEENSYSNDKLTSSEDDDSEIMDFTVSSLEKKEKAAEILIGKQTSFVYICSACSEKFMSLQAIEDHKINNHPNVYCTHLEIEDNQLIPPELYTTFCSPVGALYQCTVPVPVSQKLSCTKCHKMFRSVPELHQHILECGDASDFTKQITYNTSLYEKKGRPKRKNFFIFRTPSKRFKQTYTEPKQEIINNKTSKSDSGSVKSSSNIPETVKKQSLQCNNCFKTFQNQVVFERHKLGCPHKAVSDPTNNTLLRNKKNKKQSNICIHCKHSFLYVASLKKHLSDGCPNLRELKAKRRSALRLRRSSLSQIKVENLDKVETPLSKGISTSSTKSLASSFISDNFQSKKVSDIVSPKHAKSVPTSNTQIKKKLIRGSSNQAKNSPNNAEGLIESDHKQPEKSVIPADLTKTTKYNAQVQIEATVEEKKVATSDEKSTKFSPKIKDSCNIEIKKKIQLETGQKIVLSKVVKIDSEVTAPSVNTNSVSNAFLKINDKESKNVDTVVKTDMADIDISIQVSKIIKNFEVPKETENNLLTNVNTSPQKYQKIIRNDLKSPKQTERMSENSGEFNKNISDCVILKATDKAMLHISLPNEISAEQDKEILRHSMYNESKDTLEGSRDTPNKSTHDNLTFRDINEKFLNDIASPIEINETVLNRFITPPVEIKKQISGNKINDANSIAKNIEGEDIDKNIPDICCPLVHENNNSETIQVQNNEVLIAEDNNTIDIAAEEKEYVILLVDEPATPGDKKLDEKCSPQSFTLGKEQQSLHTSPKKIIALPDISEKSQTALKLAEINRSVSACETSPSANVIAAESEGEKISLDIKVVKNEQELDKKPDISTLSKHSQLNYHHCPHCLRTFTYLANYKKHMRGGCLIKKHMDEGDTSFKEPDSAAEAPSAQIRGKIESTVITLFREQSKQSELMSSTLPASKSTNTSPRFRTFSCSVCHKIFLSYFKMLQHRLSHKLQTDDSKSLSNLQLSMTEEKSDDINFSDILQNKNKLTTGNNETISCLQQEYTSNIEKENNLFQGLQMILNAKAKTKRLLHGGDISTVEKENLMLNSPENSDSVNKDLESEYLGKCKETEDAPGEIQDVILAKDVNKIGVQEVDEDVVEVRSNKEKSLTENAFLSSELPDHSNNSKSIKIKPNIDEDLHCSSSDHDESPIYKDEPLTVKNKSALTVLNIKENFKNATIVVRTKSQPKKKLKDSPEQPHIIKVTKKESETGSVKRPKNIKVETIENFTTASKRKSESNCSKTLDVFFDSRCSSNLNVQKKYTDKSYGVKKITKSVKEKCSSKAVKLLARTSKTLKKEKKTVKLTGSPKEKMEKSALKKFSATIQQKLNFDLREESVKKKAAKKTQLPKNLNRCEICDKTFACELFKDRHIRMAHENKKLTKKESKPKKLLKEKSVVTRRTKL